MWSWVVTVALYGVGIGFFHLVGGFGSAAKALTLNPSATFIRLSDSATSR